MSSKNFQKYNMILINIVIIYAKILVKEYQNSENTINSLNDSLNIKYI